MNYRKEVCKEKYPIWKKVIIEALATYVVLLVHFIAADGVDATTDAGKLAVSLVQGFVVYHIVSLFWRAGPHANFFFTPLALLSKAAPRIDIITWVLYLIVQFGFAVLAGLTAMAILGTSSTLGIPVITTTTGVAILVESLLALLSALAFLTVSVNYQRDQLQDLKHNNPALVLGLTHVVLVFVGLVSGTGGCVNPLRHFGVAVFVGFASNSWIYYVSHLIGAVVALIVFLVVLRESARKAMRRRS